MSYSTTINVGRGQALTVTANASSAGTYRRIDPSGTNTQYALTTVSASTSATIGPFTADRAYEIQSDPGLLTYSVAFPDDNEVLATSPAITTPTITSPTITGGTQTSLNVVTNVAADGAITIAAGIVSITKSSAAALLTLAAPTAGQEGTIIYVTSRTAKAHTITATTLLQDGVTGGAKTTATFAAFAGASIILAAINLNWHVLALNAVTIS